MIALAEEKEFVLGVDLDGTCGDFYGCIRPLVSEWLERPLEEIPLEVGYDLAEWGIREAPGGYEEFHRFAVTQRELFLRMKPMPGAGPVLRRLSRKYAVRIRIITHRLLIKHHHQVAVAQTVEWLDKHGIPYWDLCFMRDKGRVDADLYIEDAPQQIESLRQVGRRVIVFRNSTNNYLPGPAAASWLEVEQLVLKELAEFKG